METVKDARKRATHIIGELAVVDLENCGMMVVPIETFEHLQKLLSVGIEYFMSIEGTLPKDDKETEAV